MNASSLVMLSALRATAQASAISKEDEARLAKSVANPKPKAKGVKK